MIEKIQKQATAELVAAVKSGTISINAAAAVASLPEEEQKAAAIAGKDELKQAAKRVREAKRKPRDVLLNDQSPEPEVQAAAQVADEVKALHQRIAELVAENEALRQQLARILE